MDLLISTVATTVEHHFWTCNWFTDQELGEVGSAGNDVSGPFMPGAKLTQWSSLID